MHLTRASLRSNSAFGLLRHSSEKLFKFRNKLVVRRDFTSFRLNNFTERFNNSTAKTKTLSFFRDELIVLALMSYICELLKGSSRVAECYLTRAKCPCLRFSIQACTWTSDVCSCAWHFCKNGYRSILFQFRVQTFVGMYSQNRSYF